MEVPGRWWQKPHRLPESSDEAWTGEAYVKHKYIMGAATAIGIASMGGESERSVDVRLRGDRRR